MLVRKSLTSFLIFSNCFRDVHKCSTLLKYREHVSSREGIGSLGRSWWFFTNKVSKTYLSEGTEAVLKDRFCFRNNLCVLEAKFCKRAMRLSVILVLTTRFQQKSLSPGLYTFGKRRGVC